MKVELLPDGAAACELTESFGFSHVQLTLRDMDGQDAMQTFTECRAENGWAILTAEDEASSAELSFRLRGNVLLLEIKACWKEREPRFQKQRTFARMDGIILELSTGLSHQSQSLPCMAVYQHKAWWLRPAFPNGLAKVPERTQLLLWKQDTLCTSLLAVSGDTCRTDLSGTESGVRVSMSSNCDGMTACGGPAIACSWGADPYRCCRDSAALALEALGRTACLRENKSFPEMFNQFGWCTWDAFYHKVNEKDILQKMEEFRQKGIPAKWVLIDDGWSDADYSRQRLNGFGAAPEKFPEGLAATVGKLKTEYAVENVGVWQAAMGYWNGLEPDSAAERESRAWLTEMPDGRRVPTADEGKAFAFWNHWHEKLEHDGVGFAKVDEQSAVSIFHEGRHSYGQSCRAAHAGLEASAALHFHGNLINCMGMAPEDLWNRSGAAALSRSSDDFVPNTEHGFREHAIQNGFNSLLHGLFYWGDWDMFWSEHAEAHQNSILRAVSGGPVYTSDAAGKSNPQEILPLVLEDGRLLRCDDCGVPTMDCLFTDPVNTPVPLKLWNRKGDWAAVGAFHICGDASSCSGSLGGEDIPGFSDKSIWCYDWEAQKVYLLQPGERMEFLLEPNGAKLFLLLPAEAPVVPLGLTEKYLSPAAIRVSSPTAHGMLAELEQGGCFAFLSQCAPASVEINGAAANWKQEGYLFTVDCPNGRPVVQVRMGGPVISKSRSEA